MLIKNRTWVFSLLFSILFLVSACTMPWSNSTPDVVNTSEPTEVVNTSEVMNTSVPPVVATINPLPFQNIGCDWQTDDYAVCAEGSIPKKMGCDTLSTVSDYINLLVPDGKFVSCTYDPQIQTPPDTSEAKGLYDSGCLNPVKQRLLAYQEGDYLLIRDLEDLKYNFTPITTEDQALGYVLAATGYEAIFDLDSLQNYRILTDILKITSVEPVADGYQVIVFEYSKCGCGPHTTSRLTINVTTAGDIVIVESTPAFQNPEEDDLCVE